MDNQAAEYDIDESTEIGAFSTDEIDAYCWRMEQLLRAGYSHVLADCLATDGRVDLHAACDLIARGCPEGTAYLIMA